MTPTKMKTKLLRQGPANESTMFKALDIHPIEYARWTKGDHQFSEAELDRMLAWAKGEYGYSNVSGRWARVTRPATEVGSLPVRAAPVVGSSETFTAGQGSSGVTVSAKAKRPPAAATKQSILLAREREAEEQKRQQGLLAKMKSAFKPAAVQPLYPAGHPRSA
jgi:hypothetical protein